MKLAIIGSGISGLVAVYRLHAEHDIQLFEANDYVGGHTNTVTVEFEGERHALDKGFSPGAAGIEAGLRNEANPTMRESFGFPSKHAIQSAEFPLARYGLLGICTVAQGITIAISWPLWQVRDHPPHLPLIDLPQLPFGWTLMLSLVLVLARPRLGVLLHVATLLLSFVFDQFRTQPQFIAIACLMFATVDERAMLAAKWFLASLWLWAGLHKFLSPDWMGFRSWVLIGELGLDQQKLHDVFAVSVALFESVLGLVAIVRPRVAAVFCFVLHVSIVFFLSPWGIGWNYSVIPWNLCTAIVGYWILCNSTPGLPRTLVEACAAAVFVLMPVGFYTGHVDHGIANVLYSDNLPRGLISNDQEVREIEGWGDLRVPFPNERRLFRIYFERSVSPGSKLHIADPRPWLEDQYFFKQRDGTVVEVTRDRFFAAADGELAGVGLDSSSSVFALSQAGARMLKRTPESMIYAVEIPPDRYDEALLRHLAGLPNLEQLQLEGCRVRDRDLRHVRNLRMLRGIGLDDTDVTDAGLRDLAQLPSLSYIEYRHSQITESELRRIRGQ